MHRKHGVRSCRDGQTGRGAPGGGAAGGRLTFLRGFLKGGTRRKLKKLASTVGRLVALEPATGPCIAIATRPAGILVDVTAEQKGWGAWIEVPEEVHRSLGRLQGASW